MYISIFIKLIVLPFIYFLWCILSHQLFLVALYYTPPSNTQEEVTTLFLYTLQPELLAGLSPQDMEQHFAVYRMRAQGTNVGPCINQPVSAYYESLPQALQSEKEAIVRTAAAATTTTAAAATVSDTSGDNDMDGTGGTGNAAVVEDIGVTAPKEGVEEVEPAATNTEAERVTADAAREAVEAIETVEAVEAAVGAVGAVGAADDATTEPMYVQNNDAADATTATSTSTSTSTPPPILPPSAAVTTVTTTAMTTETAVTPLKTVPPFPTVPTLCCCPMVCSFLPWPIRVE
jgi:hypothetical protein